jgi:hypothetical protein
LAKCWVEYSSSSVGSCWISTILLGLCISLDACL